MLPSASIAYSPVEPYNAVLSMNHLVENADFVNIVQNQALYNICSRSLRIAAPSYADFNYIIGLQMSDLSSSLRFGGSHNTNMRKTLVNIVPFPRLHFFGCSFAPLDSQVAEPTSAVRLSINSHCLEPRSRASGLIGCRAGPTAVRRQELAVQHELQQRLAHLLILVVQRPSLSHRG